MKRHIPIFAGLMLILGLPDLALADGHELNGSDTAWLLTATALVLFMTIPASPSFTAASYAPKMYSPSSCSASRLPQY